MEMDGNFTLSDRRDGIALAVVLTIEVILAAIANGAVLCITIYQRKHWRQPSTIFFTSLILAHLVMMLLYLPFTITALAAGEWSIGRTNEQRIGTCFFSIFLYMYTVLIVLMTLAAISFDRFLFIVKPHLHKRFMKLWVAVSLAVAIWILSAVLNVIPLFSFEELTYDDTFGPCYPSYLNTLAYALFIGIIFVTMIAIIVVTCTWTFCFTRKFLKDQSIIAGESVYSAKKRRLFGIFGSMLLVYIICFTPGGIHLALIPIIDTPFGLYATSLASYHFITIANPLVQSYFRPEIKSVFVSAYHKMSPVSVTVNDTV
ncbi:PREDICTED: G-protein coupled receptor 161-like [Amphimedon queenslandica]|uniref:G-protein coupled receptors family 1 profile domain-containing protein n=1 Tax=Amphimedon queenslandica TaxID=400682 RepID=A0A1X7UCD2_AMPQE|nr:PREDICTED: G-protein coupled receptor 161-like [Amphimedon queenslandica]|eukprot:XP_011405490.2 PREDICTED: G-protein coupled receptor 161-like [Amphimedon queenslandica]